MADITVVPASIRAINERQTITRKFTAGETMTPGQPVYMSGNDTVSLTDGSALTTAACIGVVLSCPDGAASAAANDEVDVVLFGPVTGYTTNMAVGPVYVDDDAGILATATGTITVIVGIGINATTMLVNPQIVAVA